MKRLVVVGSINLDLVSAADRIPKPGETLTGTRFQTFPGGKGANQAFAARRLGAPVSMIGKVGNDAFGGPLRENLRSAGVDTSAVEDVETSSGIAQILTAPDGENVIVVVPGANARLLPEDLDRHMDLIRSARILLAQLEIPTETVAHLAELARRQAIPLMLDPAPARPLPPSLLAAVEWLTPNESETCTLLGMPPGELPMDQLREVAESLLAKGSAHVLLKLGPRGCYLALGDGRRFYVPAYRVNAVDTTAAGDAFNAAFATSLCRGSDPARAAAWASAVAAISVTRPGAQSSMPTLAEVERFLEERPDAVRPAAQ
jgi:ribokinase